jgi:EpsI family protein
MKLPPIKNYVLLALMLLAAWLAVVLRPTISVADELPPIKLATMVPTAFGEWREQVGGVAAIVDPQQKETLDRIYNEVLTRTYINPQGYRIMLSIAYGKNQQGDMQLHKPEVCYPAQGFTLMSLQAGQLDLLGKPIAATRLEASLGQRIEPITYWTIVGDQVTATMVDKRLAEMRYAMIGRIPDGMLVRVSSIDRGKERAYEMQGRFARDMVQAIAPEHRNRFAGKQQSD